MRALVLLSALVAGPSLISPSRALADEKPEPVAALEPFPLISPDGKPLAARPGQTTFRVPLGFARVEAYYRARLGADKSVTLTTVRSDGGRTLTIASRRAGDAWIKAVVREGPVDTSIDVTPVVRFQGDTVSGAPPRPLIQFIIAPSTDEVRRQANEIDHTTRTR